MIGEIKNAFISKGYTWYENTPYKLNIFGIRNDNPVINKFNDTIYCVYQNEKLEWVIKRYNATTDPGLTYTKKLLNPKGVAILVPGQYLNVYAIDKHQGEYEALCQRLGNVNVYRDGNLNNTHEFDPKTIQSGSFGINIHRANKNGITEDVNGWSAGCQVFKSIADFYEFMGLAKKHKEKHGNKFTYTLFNKKDLPFIT